MGLLITYSIKSEQNYFIFFGGGEESGRPNFYIQNKYAEIIYQLKMIKVN